MKLSADDASLFYEMMGSLRFFVNQHCNILPHCASLEDYVVAPPNEQLKVRNALYENLHLLDTFLSTNPAQLSDDKLKIVQSWRHFVSGSFFVERYLKKGTI